MAYWLPVRSWFAKSVADAFSNVTLPPSFIQRERDSWFEFCPFGRVGQTFLTDGRVEIDSNRVESLIRPIALNRKNALFAGHDEGGIAWGRIASLIETCKINGIEPLA